jgi:hypothetical protein
MNMLIIIDLVNEKKARYLWAMNSGLQVKVGALFSPRGARKKGA